MATQQFRLQIQQQQEQKARDVALAAKEEFEEGLETSDIISTDESSPQASSNPPVFRAALPTPVCGSVLSAMSEALGEYLRMYRSSVSELFDSISSRRAEASSSPLFSSIPSSSSSSRVMLHN